MIPRELMDAAKALAEKSDRHSRGRTSLFRRRTRTPRQPFAGVFQSEPDAEYVKFLTKKIAEGIEKAHKNLAPAKIGWGVARGAEPGLQPPLEDESPA